MDGANEGKQHVRPGRIAFGAKSERARILAITSCHVFAWSGRRDIPNQVSPEVWNSILQMFAETFRRWQAASLRFRITATWHAQRLRGDCHVPDFPNILFLLMAAF